MPESQTEHAKHIACAEIVPGCSFTASAATDEELVKKVAAHAAKDHGITEITPELAAKVQAAIKNAPTS
jgi:predicted small metal-binding protein